LSCGTEALPLARFCRQCGAMLDQNNSVEFDSDVSPKAPTVPLDSGPILTSPVGELAEKGNSARATTKLQLPESTNLLPSSESSGRSSSQSSESQGEPAHNRELQNNFSGLPQVDFDVDRSGVAETQGGKWRVAATFFLGISIIATTFAIFRAGRLRDNRRAEESFISINDNRRAFESYLDEAREFLATGESEAARSRLESAREVAPRDVPSLLNLAHAMKSAGLGREAIEVLKEAVILEPGNPETVQSLAEALREQGKTNEANALRLALAPAAEPAGEKPAANLRTAKSADDVAGSRQISENLEEHGRNFSARSRDRVSTKALVSKAATSGIRGRNPEKTNFVATLVPVTATSPETKALYRTAAWHPSNSIDKNDPEKLYIEGLRMMNGRDAKKLGRAELVRSLELFQYASLSGPHRNEARRAADNLGKEYDRRRK
jgi:Tfp pilus assembly protein PilF